MIGALYSVLVVTLVSGMSVSIGHIVQGRKTYVAGAPRKMRNFGQVALYVQGQARSKLELQFTFTGQQIASGFGYDLTVADFNSDGSVSQFSL